MSLLEELEEEEVADLCEWQGELERGEFDKAENVDGLRQKIENLEHDLSNATYAGRGLKFLIARVAVLAGIVGSGLDRIAENYPDCYASFFRAYKVANDILAKRSD